MNVSERIIVAKKIRTGALRPNQINEFIDELRWARAIENTKHHDPIEGKMMNRRLFNLVNNSAYGRTL